MRIGIGVDGSVQQNSVANTFRKVIDSVAFDVVRKKIAQDNFRLVKGQVNVSEKIHFSKLQRPYLIRCASAYICKNFYTQHDAHQIHFWYSRNHRRPTN